MRWLTMEEVRNLPPLPSGYRTDRVFHLLRRRGEGVERWELREVALNPPLIKTYDQGTAEEWLASYLDEGDATRIAFLSAERAGCTDGLLACRHLEWNGTLWLLDIRVREAVRREGVGSALLAELKRHACRLGVRGILVETQTTNSPAIRFYQRHGFVVSGFNDHLYSNDDLENQEVAVYLFWEAEGS